MQIPTWVRRSILIFLRYLYACELSFTFRDTDTVAFLIISTIVTHHTLTLVSSSCNDAQSCDHASLQYHIVYCRHVHHSIMMNITWLRFDESGKQLTLGHMTTIFVAASLIGRNAVMWRWALSYVHRFTVTRGDIIMSPEWHYNVAPGDVMWHSLNANVRYILRCFCLHSVCFFGILL